MQIILCLDDRNGMSFNGRRLSSDRVVCQRIADAAQGNLWVHSSSARLFAEFSVCVDEDLLDKAEQADSCFVESLDFLSRLEQITMITVYRWNRHYPSDVKLPNDLLSSWTQVSSTEFQGNSHDIITEEKYVP